jgi:hypothetical protein
MNAIPASFLRVHWGHRACHRGALCPRTQGGLVEDLAYIGLTILVFAVLWLLVKGVEHFER